jgi:hypothetical protein
LTVSFTEVFGGTTIYPSDVSYLTLTLDGNVSLEWPLENPGTDTPVARIIDIDPSGSFSITMPPADETGVGQTVLFNNLGPDVVTVLDNVGGTLLSISAGQQWQIYLTDNSTVAGTWRTFQYGASTAQAQASALAGQGLVATGSTLSQQYPVTEFSANFTAGTSNRAATLVWTGAGGTLGLPAASSAGTGWFVNLRNSGSGALTVDPNGSEQINGSATLVLQPGDSAVAISNGTNWYTVGLGQEAVFAFDYTSIDLTGQSSPYVLSGAELNRIAYKFVGTLTANMEIVVPSTIQQYWVDNATTGSFTLGLRTPSQVAPTNVAQGSRAIFYSDGSVVIDADTSGIAVPISIADGGTGATSAGAALVNLGGTTDGIAIFTAGSTNDIWTTLGPAPIGTVNGGTF